MYYPKSVSLGLNGELGAVFWLSAVPKQSSWFSEQAAERNRSAVLDSIH